MTENQEPNNQNQEESTPEIQQPVSKEQELLELLQRTQANFENYRKQNLKQIEEYKQFACKDVILQLLPLLDNFELALKVSTSSIEDLKKGIELIYAQLFQILEAQGVTLIVTTNATFDPHLHEPLMKVESDLPTGTILEEFQKGFMVYDKVIRHAKVKISAGIVATKNESTQHKDQIGGK